jgi:prepilin-type N-terminal cleavage/methylation domain-containing protein
MKRHGFTLVELMIVVAIISLVAVICFGGGGCSRSVGQRRGTISKFSEKGIVWKSHEGQLVCCGLVSTGEGGSAANVWNFSVYNDNGAKPELIARLNAAMESDRPVLIKYRQYFFHGPWNASTSYDVTDVRLIGDTKSPVSN